MSFHFRRVFPLISDRSVWHNGKHPYSKAVISLAEDFIDENVPTLKDPMNNRTVTTSDENGKSVTKDSEACFDNSMTDEGMKRISQPRTCWKIVT